KIIASGTSSLTIKNNIQETLAGRKRIITILPLNFEEFLLFKEERELLDSLNTLKNLKGKGLSATLKSYYLLLEEFMTFG
ncbi:MAG: AAA family ATPase, partial [Candidatus Peribacteria bacterium]|nr:AAA family ATPase [Candidatus Peribacteria bacterium]